MSNTTEALEPVEIYRHDEGLDYMSDMKNWLCVHVTKYDPKRNDNGDLAIETTAMATGYKLPRATVHVTLNQLVGNNIGGNWDAASIVILMPYLDVVNKNGNPLEVAVADTYFAPNPDTGLVLPESAYLIKPDPNSKELFVIGEHGATYKTDNYSDEEVDKILTLCNNFDKEKYNQYLNGDVPEYDVERMLGYDKKLLELYNNAKNKQAFMRGVLEEDRFLILNRLLRDYVTQKSMEKLGYHYVFAHEDNVSGKVANMADDIGINGNSGNKGHSNSVECELEIHGCALASLSDVLKSKNVDKIVQYLTEFKRPLSDEVIDNILSDKQLPDIYKTFETVYDQFVENLKWRYDLYTQDPNMISERAKRYWKREIKAKDKKLEAYNPNLATTLRRHSKRMQLECSQALKELKQNPEIYAQLKQRLNRSGGDFMAFYKSEQTHR